MAGAIYFTVADTRNGYWHVQLDDKSQKYTTFNTPWGKYCFKRLAFGLTCADDAFQQRLDQVLSGLKRVTGITDDILVWGNTIAEHDNHFDNCYRDARMLASDSTTTNSSTN